MIIMDPHKNHGDHEVVIDLAAHRKKQQAEQAGAWLKEQQAQVSANFEQGRDYALGRDGSPTIDGTRDGV